jgi:hypothetical protein
MPRRYDANSVSEAQQKAAACEARGLKGAMVAASSGLMAAQTSGAGDGESFTAWAYFSTW